VKIERMTKGEWGKTRAFFDVRTEEGMIVKGFKLIEGEGLFVGMPSVKDKDGNYNNTVYLEKLLKEELLRIAIDSYNNSNKFDKKVQDIVDKFDGIPS
tara:strand:+ start:210 stop:503 length:294 start_codon:yes stop_codon:yes gene_type:complete